MELNLFDRIWQAVEEVSKRDCPHYILPTEAKQYLQEILSYFCYVSRIYPKEYPSVIGSLSAAVWDPMIHQQTQRMVAILITVERGGVKFGVSIIKVSDVYFCGGYKSVQGDVKDRGEPSPHGVYGDVIAGTEKGAKIFWRKLPYRTGVRYQGKQVSDPYDYIAVWE